MAKSNRGLGRKPDELLTKLVVKSQGTDGKPSWSCIAPKCSYTAKGFPRNSRVMKHSASCKALREYDEDAYDDAHRAAVGGSLGSQLQQLEPSAKNSESNPSFSTSSPTIVSPSGSSLLTAKGTLDLKTLRTEGSKSKANSHKKFQHEVDHIIMRLICVRGLVPNLVDSPEWKELMQKLNGIYKPTSGDTFRDSYIPKEAAFVRNSQIDLLKKEENLTLTFDGTTIRKQESFYTAHATTPARDTYFLNGHQGTGEHHNADWIMDKLLKVRST